MGYNDTMRPTTIRTLTLALTLAMAQPALAQMVSPDVLADYQRRCAEYQAVHDAYEAHASASWSARLEAAFAAPAN